jgi:hypothetical protein
MRQHQIRPLPVLHGAELVAISSQRDRHFVETLANLEPS